MKSLFFQLSVIFILLFISLQALSATLPIEPVNKGQAAIHKKIISLKVRDIQRITGKKLSLKQKIVFGLLKRKLKRQNEEVSSKGQLALTFGIIGAALLIGGLFVGALLIGSLIAAIAAIVIGSVAKKKNPDDRKALAGVLLGWITLGLIVALLLLFALFWTAIF